MTRYTTEDLTGTFREIFEECTVLMQKKNADYGGSWEADRSTTLTDTIRHKIDRVRQLEDNEIQGRPSQISEGIDSELTDIINYCVFRKIKERERNERGQT